VFDQSPMPVIDKKDPGNMGETGPVELKGRWYFKRPHTRGYGKAVARLSESCPKIGTISKTRFFPLAALVPSAGTKIFQIELYAVRHAHPCADPSARPLTKGEKPCKFPRN
jgi:hypothetical protein